MATAEYAYTNRAGCTYRVRHTDAATWVDEPYPPGGFLRVIRNAAGRIIAGPMVSELHSWTWQD
jgi:hypothetical protein